MEDKEIEKLLQDSADNIPTRDFSEIWDNIKDVIEKEQPPKKAPAITFKRLLPIILSACLVLCCAIGIPVYLHYVNLPTEIIYYEDELGEDPVSQTEFLYGLSETNVEFIDFSKYSLSECVLYKTTDKEEVKGGKVDVADNSSFIAKLKFYHKSVKLDQADVTYDNNYTTTGGVVTEYKLASSESGIYVYKIKANYKSVNYFIELTCFSQDITPFLNNFFS